MDDTTPVPNDKILRETAIFTAIMQLLVAHGLPTECFDGAVPWKGTPDQVAACEALHSAILRALPTG